MKTTKEQRAELRARTPTSQQSMYQLYVRRAELHAVLDDLDEAESRAERLRQLLLRGRELFSLARLTDNSLWARRHQWTTDLITELALAETAQKTEGRGIPRTNDDGERRGNIHPAQAPDDAERAAVEAWQKLLTKDDALAFIRARDEATIERCAEVLESSMLIRLTPND